MTMSVAEREPELINQLLDPCLPKTEREHAAAKEIEKLRAKYTALLEWIAQERILVQYRRSTRPDGIKGSYWVMRRVASIDGDSCLGWHESDPAAAVEAALGGVA